MRGGNTLRETSYQFSVGGQSETGNLAWNANGTLQQLAITDPFNSSDQQTCNYAYDDLARAASFNCGGFSQTFSADPFGNEQKTGTLSFLPVYNNMTNQIGSVGGQTFGYDPDGNLQSTGTGIGTTSYTWSAEGKMLSATPYGSSPVTVTYDALGRAVELNTGAAPCNPCQLVYDPAGEALATTTGQTLYYARVPLPGGVSAIYGSGPVLNGYWHRDWLGSVRLISSYSRTVTGDGAFAPYGESYAPSGNPAPGWFAGMSANTLSTMSDAAYRRFDPTEGRWISPDPGGLAAVDLTNPQSLNRYAYALNNPATLTDPLGLACGVGDDGTLYDDGTGGGCQEGGVAADGTITDPQTVTVTANVGPGDPTLELLWEMEDCLNPLSGCPYPPTNNGGGGASAPPKPAPPQVTKHYGETAPCAATSNQTMAAVERDFPQFGNYSRWFGAESVTFSPPSGMGPGSTIPISVSVFGLTKNLSVTVRSMNSQSMTFTTNPGHLLYPAYITFSASPASAGSINFNINLGGTIASPWEFRFGGSAFEDAQWKHFLGQVGGFCKAGG